MEKASHSINEKVKFWSILGPFMTLLIFLVYLVKLSPSHLYLSLVALGGISLCWKWKMKGLLISLVALCALLVVTFSSVPLVERFWFLGLAMASALSFVVTALSFEEIETLLDGSQEDSKNHLSYIATLDDKLNSLQKGWSSEKEKLNIDLDWAKEKQREAEINCKDLEKKNEKLLEQITQFASEQNTSKMAEKYQVNNYPLHSVKPSQDPFEPLYHQLKQQFSEKGKVLDDTRRELFSTKESLILLKKEVEEKTTYDQDDTYSTLEKDFIALSEEYDRLDELYREEISDLHSLVGTLLERN